jgi:hypothetical protein
MPLAGFEPPIPESEQPQTYALDGSATFFKRKIISIILSLNELAVTLDSYKSNLNSLLDVMFNKI